MPVSTSSIPAAGLVEDRREVISYLRQQLVGPSSGEEEVLRERPDQRYIMGILFPLDAAAAAAVEEEGEDRLGGTDEGPDDSPLSLAYERMPSSAGITFLASGGVVECQAECAIYEAEVERADGADLAEEDEKPGLGAGRRKRGQRVWRRKPLVSGWIQVPLTGQAVIRSSVLDGRAELHFVLRKRSGGFLITATLLNTATHPGRGRPSADLSLYQAVLVCRSVGGSVLPQRARAGGAPGEEEEELQLLYRRRSSFAVGHGAAASWTGAGQGAASEVRTEVMPVSEVSPLDFRLADRMAGLPAVSANILSFQRLSSDEAVEDLCASLQDFVRSYRAWIEDLPGTHSDIPSHLRGAGDRLLGRMEEAARRMEEGIGLLQSDQDSLRAFRLANRAMLMQMIRSLPEFGGKAKNLGESAISSPVYSDPRWSGLGWRPFQLAFILLSLPSATSPDHPDRKVADLIWFPTGGGKTEAYLGLAAYAIFHRRLSSGQRGAGTAVIMRYTLRLLTSQQFERAAALVCACEAIRQDSTDLGTEPVRLGLWVGLASTPNQFSTGKDDYPGASEFFKEVLEQEEPDNPFQLQRCPWCGTRIIPEVKEEDESAYGVRATDSSFSFYCPAQACRFHEVLPLSVVDEDLYQDPPTFLIGTIDKFARLAWDERSGSFFNGPPGKAAPPPSLIIQDELHLIAGPLGTVAGVYEAAIDTVMESAGGAPAKVIAATATIRRAGDQVRCLYGRDVRIFPPQGLEADDSYFARTDSETPGRLYVGAMGQGVTPTTAQVHTMAALCQAPCIPGLSEAAADGYWTLVAYHNSRRELGKTMTLSRDDVPNRIFMNAAAEEDAREITEVEELSANIPGRMIPRILDRLKAARTEREAIDILPSTNMLSVGVDVPRLGVMMVLGQPKTTAEYIQATSRVGRAEVPGVVLVLFSSTKARDRSHYEDFSGYHGAVYKFVEPASVTPFAPPSRDRALHAALVIVARHALGLSGNKDADGFDAGDAEVQRVLALLLRRVAEAEPREAAAAERHLERLCNEWVSRLARAREDGKPFLYDASRIGEQVRPLLRTFSSTKHRGAWRTLNSMRHVDPEARIEVLGETKDVGRRKRRGG